jgi:hypothetical protein
MRSSGELVTPPMRPPPADIRDASLGDDAAAPVTAVGSTSRTIDFGIPHARASLGAVVPHRKTWLPSLNFHSAFCFQEPKPQ